MPGRFFQMIFENWIHDKIKELYLGKTIQDYNGILFVVEEINVYNTPDGLAIDLFNKSTSNCLFSFNEMPKIIED